MNKLIILAARAGANTRYVTDALVLNSFARQKAEQLIAALHTFPRLAIGGAPEIQVVEAITRYSEKLQELLINVHANRDRVAALIASSLDEINVLLEAAMTPAPVDELVIPSDDGVLEVTLTRPSKPTKNTKSLTSSATPQ